MIFLRNRTGVILTLLIGHLWAADYTVVTYNLWNFQNDTARATSFRTTFTDMEPDIIVAEEVVGSVGYNHFLADVLETWQPSAWTGAPFTDQTASQDIALFYRVDKFDFISTTVVPTAQTSGQRDVVEFVLEEIASGVQFRIYGVHFKASSGSSNANMRLTEATILRNYLNDLPAGSHFLVCGDFNIYSNNSSTEPAFDMLTSPGSDPDGQLFDPVDRIGSWHNNSAFADVHTQSSRGGSYGGLDDRFDWIFTSAAVLAETYEMTYVNGTYWAYGNDGNHFNQAVNYGTNYSVNPTIANALVNASDHLPVMAKFSFPSGSTSPYQLIITEIMPNPAAVSDTYGEWFEVFNADSITLNLDGWRIKDNNGEHTITNTAMYVPIDPGDYFVFAREGDTTLNGGLETDYVYSGLALANSADEVTLIDNAGSIVDEVHYNTTFPYSSGVSMYLKNLFADNEVDTNWSASTTAYGAGDLGTPGRAWDDTLNTTPGVTLPQTISLSQNYPNPFNARTTITLTLPVKGKVHLAVYNMLGQEVVVLIDRVTEPGIQTVSWNPEHLTSGLYFYRLTAAEKQITKKMILLK
ncbi:MAG: lamin tail domain-containing protein [Fidelibacterota bacterium]